MEHTNGLRTLLALALAVVLAGCATQEQKKQVMVDKWEKSTVDTRLAMVEGLIERGQTAEAKKALDKCLAADAESARAYFLMGRVHFIENRNAQAEQAFERAIALDETMDAAWYYRGGLAFLNGDTAMAGTYYEKALSLKPAETEYLLAKAQLLTQVGDNPAAITLLEQSLVGQPRNRDLLVCLADVYGRTEQPQKAIDCYEKVLLTDGKDQAVLESLGYAYAAQKNWAKASATFERLLAVVGEGDRKEAVLNTLALCAMNAGKYALAMRCYDNLTVLRRDDAEAWLGMAQAAMGADQYDRAAACAQKALQLKPSWPQGYAVLGSAQYLQKKYSPALDLFARLLNDDEFSGFAWFMTGRCYGRMGQTAKADAAYKRAGDRSADSPLVERFLKDKTSAM